MTSSERGSRASSPDVALFCPHGLVRDGLRLLLEQGTGLRVVGSAPGTRDAPDLLSRGPDLVVVLVESDGRTCVDEIRRLQADHPSIPALVLSASTEPARVQEAVSAGARAFLPLDAGLDDLVRAIRTTARGELTLHRSIVPAYLRYLSSTPPGPEDGPTPSFEDLSPREQEVLELLARGSSDRDIGQELFISVRTVQTHLAHIYDKLDVHTRTEAALLAVREGWVS